MIKIAHRGAKAYEPENTLAAFTKAIELQSDAIEFDVHLSADGEVIVIHDETVDRVADGSGFVKNLSLSELKKMRIDGIHEIPTLSETFDFVNQRCLVNVELKAFETAEPVVKLIEYYVMQKNWQYSQFLISSFDWTALQKVRDLHAEIPLGVLTETNLELAIGFAEFVKAETIHPYFHLLTEENTRNMQQRGFKVFAWTVNELEDIQKIKSFKANGIISDFPDRL
ncbi:glycerophosphoryl diester phosphodiesterase [Flavobacterium noncentrifugens]|uniref:Glycerophosphoryl diester phosphodiesterase n=1 Tax=Flavobacterium noncentrifugens TaxID=1128970 RepID=A0A1G9AW65_9FLAO|nr:glycerophosphodiester phosphodiesterase family protein [Flavobacterium noncentrifugens]GEP51587.1 glycerophosphoryl diester phosphodiesterase [Flavobacterium noncentrifugens]SDK30900.1 glycerophosphoryl diester phosphodiesterase [Flavobacterium noncentrifugens]